MLEAHPLKRGQSTLKKLSVLSLIQRYAAVIVAGKAMSAAYTPMPPDRGRSVVIYHPLFPVLGCGQRATVLRMVWNGRVPVRTRAVSTTVLTSASPFAAHMARKLRR